MNITFGLMYKIYSDIDVKEEGMPDLTEAPSTVM